DVRRVDVKGRSFADRFLRLELRRPLHRPRADRHSPVFQPTPPLRNSPGHGYQRLPGFEHAIRGRWRRDRADGWFFVLTTNPQGGPGDCVQWRCVDAGRRSHYRWLRLGFWQREWEIGNAGYEGLRQGRDLPRGLNRYR